MKKLLNYLPFHFLIGLTAGILLYYFTLFWNNVLFGFFGLSLLLMYIFNRSVLFQWLSGMVFLILGIFVTHNWDDRNDSSYYQKYVHDESSSVLRISKALKSNAYSNRYEAEVVQVDSVQTIGTIVLSIRKDSLMNEFEIDNQLLVKKNFSDINRPLNPHQFDYKAYLARQGIHQQVYLDHQEYLRIQNAQTFLGRIANLRTRIQQSLKTAGFQNDELGVINALLLGQRNEVSKELLNDYSKAGAIYILAISGLHVGIILLILSWLLKPVEFIKHGKLLKLILIVVILWFFAMLAGMSASVVRAVTMFTAVAIGQSLNRKSSVVHSLIFSMFVLLLCKPMFLFDVGFQLSYIAVYGIVTMQPKLVELWKPKWKLIHKIWQLTTVSLAAQLAVLPLSLFYFHQFPGLFLLSNLVIVPFLGVILLGGILVILLSLLSMLPQFVLHLYEGIISWMNSFIRFVSEQESFLFSGISFSVLMMLSSYVLIIQGFRFFEKRQISRIYPLLLTVLTFQSVLFIEKYQVESSSELVIFNQRRASQYVMRFGSKIVTSKSASASQNITSYVTGEKVKSVLTHESENLLKYKGQHILFVDSLGVYNIKGLRSPIVILQHSPKINLMRLIKTLKPSQIVADGSNYKSLIKYWRKTSLQSKVPFWSTYENGAYILE